MTDLFESPTMHQDVPSRQSRAASRERRAAKRRAKRRRRAAVVIVLTLALVAGAGYYVVRNMETLFGFNNPALAAKDYPGPGGEAVDVVIEPGSTGTAMGNALLDAGVVASVKAFVDAYEATPGAGSIQHGTHTLLTEMKASDAVARLIANDNRVEMRLTIPEGFTVEQIIDRAVSVTAFPREDFEEAMEDPEALGLPAEAEGSYEGWLFPTTYVFQPGDDAADILATMIRQMTAELDSLEVDAEDRRDLVIMASLLEREGMNDEQYGRVARVIMNRLERGEPLGLDAIDSYGLGKPASEITRSEFRDPDLPYASRVHRGLPPTAIGSPGRETLSAVLNAPEGPWLWYVTVNLNTGETKFTDNYNEFLEFRQEYQRWAAENGG